MKNSGKLLPVEVWQNILDQIEDDKQWLQCKLVCRMWESMVDMATLKQVILSERYIGWLYSHLLKHPRHARYIHSIQLLPYDRSFYYPIDLEDLFKLAMTSNLKAVTGEFKSEHLDMLFKVVQGSTEVVNLGQVPVNCYINETSLALLNHCKETLKSMELHMRPLGDTLRLADGLGQLKYLVKLDISDTIGRLVYLKELDSILNNCTHLNKLQLFEEANQPPESKQVESEKWISEVAKVKSMRSITLAIFRSTFYKDSTDSLNRLLWYLAVKYPNLDDIRLWGMEQDETTIIDTSVFKHVTFVHLKNWRFGDWTDVVPMVNAWKSRINSITIEYDDKSNKRWSKYFCYMTIVRSKQTDHTQFTIYDIAPDTQLDTVIKILFILGESTNTVKCSQDNMAPPIPAFESLPLTALTIDMTRLHTLSLANMNLEIQDFIHLAELFPYLEHLTLTSVSIDANLQQQKARHVTLPGVHLNTLTLQTNRSMRYTEINARSEILGDAFFLISFDLLSTSQVFFAGASSKSLVRLSKSDFDLVSSRQAAAESIYIECKSLKHLVVNMDDIRFQLTFDAKGCVVASNPPIVNSTRRQLKRGILSPSTDLYIEKSQRQQSLLYCIKNNKEYLKKPKHLMIVIPD